VFKDTIVGSTEEPENLGEKLAKNLLDMGAKEVLEEIYRGSC